MVWLKLGNYCSWNEGFGGRGRGQCNVPRPHKGLRHLPISMLRKPVFAIRSWPPSRFLIQICILDKLWHIENEVEKLVFLGHIGRFDIHVAWLHAARNHCQTLSTSKEKNANNKQWTNTGFRSDEADVNMNELSAANGLIQIQKHSTLNWQELIFVITD